MGPWGLTLAVTLTLNFQVKYGICCISAKNGPIATKCKVNILNLDIKWDQWVWPWPWPWIFKAKCNLHFWSHTWPWPWIFMSNFEIAVSQEWEGRLTLNKGDGSRCFMTIAMTCWWPMWGVKIYRIVTGVPSDVGVPSTHLVFVGMSPHFLAIRFRSLIFFSLSSIHTGKSFHIIIHFSVYCSVGCHYHYAVWYNMCIFQISLQWLWQNINQNLGPQKTA